MNFVFLVKLVPMILLTRNLIHASDSHGIKGKKQTKNAPQNSLEIDESSSEFATEEYSKKVHKAHRVGRYQVVLLDVNDLSAQKKSNHSPRTRSKKSSEAFESTDLFNDDLDSVSGTSSVADECPRFRPHVTDRNANSYLYAKGRHTRLLQHLPNKFGDFTPEKFVIDADILSAQVRKSDLYTMHDEGFDSFSSMSKKERRLHYRRVPSVHPHRRYNRANEIDPHVPVYEEDVPTSQKEKPSHFGRSIGRDNKPKLFPNRDTFSSVVDGCTIC